jgi:hypothetical protein
LWKEQQAIRAVSSAKMERPGVAAPDPRHMDPMLAYAAWPSNTFSLSQRLWPEPEPLTDDVGALLSFTASALPSELGEDDIMQLLIELRRRGEAVAGDLLQILEPSSRNAGRRVLLWLIRAGLVVVVGES